jgi:hypothetical protein
MKLKLIAVFVFVSIIQLSFDLPKNQQPQMFGSPYYAELINKHKVSEQAKFGYLPSRYANFDEPFMSSNSSVIQLLLGVDSFFQSKSAIKIHVQGKFKSHDFPEVYFGPMNEGIDRPLYVQSHIEGYAPNQVVMAATKGKKKLNAELISLMNANNLEYLFVPVLRESFVYPSGILKERGILSSTSSSAKNYYIDLGTNHVIRGEKLQSLSDPVGVFVLCVGLMNKEGKIVAMVSEGLGMLQQSNIAEQILNIRTKAAPKDIDYFLTKKRSDLPNQPLAWEEACTQAYLHLMQKNTFVPSVKYQMNTN